MPQSKSKVCTYNAEYKCTSWDAESLMTSEPRSKLKRRNINNWIVCSLEPWLLFATSKRKFALQGYKSDLNKTELCGFFHIVWSKRKPEVLCSYLEGSLAVVVLYLFIRPSEQQHSCTAILERESICYTQLVKLVKILVNNACVCVRSPWGHNFINHTELNILKILKCGKFCV